MAEERILVVDDEPGVRSALEGILSDEGFEVVSRFRSNTTQKTRSWSSLHKNGNLR